MHKAFAIVLGLTACLTTPVLAGSGTPGTLDAASPAVSETVIGPSGLPVPRFVALKKDEVHARVGPSFDYPVAAVYRKKGLPLKVIAETSDDVWRRVEDPDGQKLWIHRSMLMGNEHAVVRASDVVLRSKPGTDAPGRAKLAQGVLAELDRCEGGWCRVKAGEFKGWLPEAILWGAPRG
jgi:SH3-like domain-containing protein